MGIFRKLKLGKKSKGDADKKREVLRRFTEEKKERFMGICPFCGEVVTFEMAENIEKLTVICKSCDMVVFYLDKLHTPPYERNLIDLQHLRDLDFG